MLRIVNFAALLSGAVALNADVGNLRTKALLQAARSEVDKMNVVELEGYTESNVVKVFEVPTTSRCIVIMVCQYMIIYTALAVCRTYHEFSETAKGSVEAGLKAASQTLTYAPMLCVLFIACRMRVEFLSGGKDEPQIWVQNCMYALTFSVLATTLMVLFVPCAIGKPLPLKEGTCDLEQPQRDPEGRDMVTFWALTIVRYAILLGLYCGLIGVVVGIHIYLPPGATDVSKIPPPAPAVQCTMILAVVFFAIQLVIAFCRSYTEFTGKEFPRLVGVIHGAANTAEFAPMLSIVFLAARMRALQHDGQPQKWAQDCMYVATFAMCATTFLAICVPLVLGGQTTLDQKGGRDVQPEANNEANPNVKLGYCLLATRFVCMLAFYGGVVAVIVSILVFEAPAGPEATEPVSPTVQCVINLASQFFFVYTVLIVCHTVSEVSGGRIPLDRYKFYSAIDQTKATLAFAPMLSILFVALRMYALLITDKKGAPQAWVQDGMFMATWSLLISFLSCLITAFVMDEVTTDEDGNIINKFTNKWVAIAMTILRYFTMLLLYGGVATVIVGLFVMTPETANGRGSIPLLSDAINATPIGKPPPGPSDIAAVNL